VKGDDGQLVNFHLLTHVAIVILRIGQATAVFVQHLFRTGDLHVIGDVQFVHHLVHPIQQTQLLKPVHCVVVIDNVTPRTSETAEISVTLKVIVDHALRDADWDTVELTIAIPARIRRVAGPFLTIYVKYRQYGQIRLLVIVRGIEIQIGVFRRKHAIVYGLQAACRITVIHVPPVSDQLGKRLDEILTKQFVAFGLESLQSSHGVVQIGIPYVQHDDIIGFLL